MSYDLGSIPDREAGPIERVVLQEDLGEASSESDVSSERVNSNDIGNGNIDVHNTDEGRASATAALALERSEASLNADGDDDDDYNPATDGGATNGVATAAAAVAALDDLGSNKSDDSGSAIVSAAKTAPGTTTVITTNSVAAAATTAIVTANSSSNNNTNGSGNANRRSGSDLFKGAMEKAGLKNDPARVSSLPRDDKTSVRIRARSANATSAVAAAVQAEAAAAGGQERTRKANSFGGGHRDGIVRGRSVSPMRSTGSRGLGWGSGVTGGSPSANGTVTFPRLSVDLINVDPVGEAVKHVSLGFGQRCVYRKGWCKERGEGREGNRMVVICFLVPFLRFFCLMQNLFDISPSLSSGVALFPI